MKRRDFVRTMTAVGTGLLLRAGSPFPLAAQQLQPDAAVPRRQPERREILRRRETDAARRFVGLGDLRPVVRIVRVR